MSRTATLRRLGLHLRELLLAWADFAQAPRAQTTVRTRDQVERMVILSTLSSLHGAPLIPSLLALRLLPYFVPKIYQWRRLETGETDFSAAFKKGC